MIKKINDKRNINEKTMDFNRPQDLSGLHFFFLLIIYCVEVQTYHQNK